MSLVFIAWPVKKTQQQQQEQQEPLRVLLQQPLVVEVDLLPLLRLVASSS